MSNIVNKVKDALHTDKSHSTTTGTTGTHGSTTTAGPHSSDIANKADPRVDSDLDGRGATGAGYGTGTGTTGTGYGTGTGTTGTGTGYGTSHTTAGPHSSDLANKADPRVDSDLDGRGAHGTHTGTGVTGTHGTHTGTHGTHTGTHGTHTGTHGTHTGATHGTHTAGPHSSDIANKADPRVDSDLDGRGARGTHTTGAGYGTTGATGTGYSGTHGTHGTGATGTAGYGSGSTGTSGAGPHNSATLNKLDPRVDSDRDGSTTVGGATTGTGHTGTHTGHTGTHTTGTGHTGTHATGTTGTTTTAGPHKSNLLNKLDPRVDSDRDGSTTVGGGTTGTGTTGTHTGTTGTHTGTGHTGTHTTGTGATGTGAGYGTSHTTAGPHSSDLANKADPRVDSDRDGSSTVGRTGPGYTGQKDPTDAAQVPPSVLASTIGQPTIGHDDKSSTHAARHGSNVG